MQITILSDETVLWQALVSAQQQASAARASGLHLSTITNDIAATVYPKEFWYLKRDEARPSEDDAFDPRTRATFEAGQAVEDAIANILRSRMGWEKPEPRRCDGIWCSPDGYSARARTIDETKATWKSSRDFVGSPKWLLYTWQVLAYMHAFSATRGRIHVLHMNGDWRPPRPAPPVTYILRPTPQEIAENWRMVRGHAKDRRWLRT